MNEVKTQENTKRSSLVDILKAIGIISVVIGHAGKILPLTNFPITKFVYCYHIMVFMFVMGFLFKKDNATPPYKYIGKTIYKIGGLFVIYNVFAVGLHNLFVALNMIDDPVYTKIEIFTRMIKSISLSSSEKMLGAFWFLHIYIFAAIIFVCCFYFAERRKKPVIYHIGFVIACMFIGVFLNHRNISLSYHFQTSFLAVPICYLGYVVKQYWDNIKKFITIYGAIIAAVLMFLIVYWTDSGIELSQNRIGSPYLFYPITLLGLYFCVGLAKFIDHFRIPRQIFAHVGKNSFHIMSLHFICIKLIDIIYGSIIHADKSVITRYPYAFNIPYAYYIVGIIMPLIIIHVLKWTQQKIMLLWTKYNQKKTELKTEPNNEKTI